MSSRKPPSGPQSMLTGFVVIPETAVASATVETTATAIANIQVPPSGTATARMNGRVMSTNDVVSWSPRTVPLSTTAQVPVALTYARVISVEAATISTALAILELGFLPYTTANATLQANTIDIAVHLRSADL